MKANRIVLAAILAACAPAFAVEPDTFAERPSGSVRVEAFWPAKTAGVLERGETAEMVLKVAGVGARRDVRAAIDLRPFGAPVARNVLDVELADGENRFVLPAQAAYGHFTVIARLTAGGAEAGFVQSAFAVVPPEPAKRDPYFMVDKNGVMDPLLDPMRRFGFGSVFMNTLGATGVIAADEAELERIVAGFRKGARTGLAAREDFRVMAAACPRLEPHREFLARAEAGLPPLTADEVRKVRRHFARLSEALSDRVDAWIVQEEIDAPRNGRSGISTNYLHYLSAWGLLARNISDGLKAGDPKCRVGMLGIYCGDYYDSTPPFAISRRILWPLVGKFDFVALDAYSGNWNRMRNRYTPPEESFAKLLSDAADLSAEYGGCREVANVERCAGIDWRAAYDSEQAVDQADYTMRSMIIGRTVTNALCYCLHLTAYLAPAKAVRKDPTKEPPADLGIWRAVMPADGTYRYVPRPAAVAAATTVRLLSFTRDPRLVRREDGVHVATFAAPGGDDGKALAAVWTADAAFEGEIDLPSGVTRIDSAGNETECPAGRWRGRVSPTPFFLRAAASARPALEKALGACRVIRFDESAGPAPILVPKGALPKAPAFALTGPGDIFPSRAVMPEAGYFPAGTTVFPSAEAKFAWDEEGLSAEVTVRHKEHVQRRSGKGVDNDDCVLFSFYDASPLSEDHPRRASHAVNFIAALGTDGPHGFVWDYDRKADHRPCGTVAAETSAGTTVYRVRMPWRDILPGFRPAKGKSLAFNLRCPFAASRTDWTAAPYMLVLQKQKSRIFQLYHSGFLDSCRQLRLD